MCDPRISTCPCGGPIVLRIDRRTLIAACTRCGVERRPPKPPPKPR